MHAQSKVSVARCATSWWSSAFPSRLSLGGSGGATVERTEGFGYALVGEPGSGLGRGALYHVDAPVYLDLALGPLLVVRRAHLATSLYCCGIFIVPPRREANGTRAGWLSPTTATDVSA